MNFLIVPDSFKNCLSASQVGHFIAEGIGQVFPEAKRNIVPIADGGEGTVQAIVSSVKGQIKKVEVHDPLMRPIESFIGLMPNKKKAVIEMAAASGIELINENERNPLKTSTYGTGELIKHALNLACSEIIIGIGGSATNDGGIGMAAALGAKFIDSQGNILDPIGESLAKLDTIDIKNLDKRLAKTKISIACDVTNTLCGTNGASKVYGPQKGATKEMVDFLDRGLFNLATKIKSFYKNDVLSIKGGGAAGGLGVGLVAFTGAQLKPGFTLISQLLNLEVLIKNTDIVISAEGKVDKQTLFGKVPSGVGQIAKLYNKPLFVFAGWVDDSASNFDRSLINALIPITRRPVNLNEALLLAPNWLKQAAKEWAITLKQGSSLT